MNNNADTLHVDTTSVAQAANAKVMQQVAPNDTIQYLGVLPSVFPDAKVNVPDTLPRLTYGRFVPTSKLSLTKFVSARDKAPGVEGTLLTKDPCSSDLSISIVLILTLMSLFILSKTHRYFFQRIHDFFIVHGSVRKFVVNTVGDARSAGILVVQTAVFISIMFFCYFVHKNDALIKVVPSYVLLIIYTAMCLVYFFLKWAAYSFLGWIFFTHKRTSIFINAYTTVFLMMGFVLYPIVLYITFSYLSPSSVSLIGLLALVFAKFLIIYKWLKLFSQKLFRYLLLILYFCALEIIPCIIFVESMIQMNNMLIKNF
jgi:hypothetical protein